MKSVYIDGYNALFKLYDISGDFSSERSYFIHTMDEQATLLNQPLSLVFDARYTPDPLMIHGLKSIRIIYTEENQSADDWLIQLVHYSSKPDSILVVTDDRDLKRQVKIHGGSTQNINSFFKNWTVRCENKEKRARPKFCIETKEKEEFSEDPDFDYWLDVFTQRMDNTDPNNDLR